MVESTSVLVQPLYNRYPIPERRSTLLCSVRKTRATPTSRQRGKPHPDFPLTVHPRGHWCKKSGRLYYFGKVADDPKGKQALAKWLDQKDACLAGRVPAVHPADAFTVARLCNDFLNYKRALRDAGEIAEATFAEYEACAKRMAKQFGRDRPVDQLVADDFGQAAAEHCQAVGSGPAGK